MDLLHQTGLIAVLIIALFTGIIATIIYNIYLSNASIKRMGTATKYITNIFENMDKEYYENITVNGLENYINTNQELFNTSNNKINISSNDTTEVAVNIGNFTKPLYTINMYIEYYNKIQGNENKLDLVKQLNVSVTYKLGNKDQTITMKRLKAREKFITPNTPDVNLIELINGKKAYSVKKINNKWKVCDIRDSGWYNYENGYWATVIISEQELKINDEINVDTFAAEGNVYVWIPRFAYNLSDNTILFLYNDTNKYIDNSSGYNSLSELQSTFKVSTDFNINDQNFIGIWVNNTSGEAYTELNSVYERKV